MWINRGEPAGKACPKCNETQFPCVIDDSGSRVMINTREDWTKKVPTGWSNFLTEFSKRHSKYGRQVDTHKRGVSEF